MKNNLKNAKSLMQQKAFTYYVKDYDNKKKVYTLENPITKDIKIMDKDQFEKMHAEQHPDKAMDDLSRKLLYDHKK